MAIFSLLISFLVYLKNKSVEGFFTVFIFFISIIILNLVRQIVNVYHIEQNKDKGS